MMDEKDKIKDLFSSKLKDFEPEVPASVWGGLDQLLSQQPAAADPSSSTSSSSGSSATASKASVIKTALITAGVAAAVVTGVLLAPKSEQTVTPEDTHVSEVEEVQPDTVASDTTAVFPTVIMKPTIARAARIEETVEEKPAPSPVQDLPVAQEKKEEKKPVIVKEKPLQASTPDEKPLLLPEKKSNSGFSVGLSANSGLLAHNSSRNGGEILFSHHVRSVLFREALYRENSEFKLQHRLPVSLGVKVSKGIAPNLSLETGVVYTYLSSKITSNSTFNIEENQSFHYLGIPLSLNYTFYELGKGKLYLSVGGMVQKDIKGKYESTMGFTKMDISDLGLDGLVYYHEPYFIRESIKQPNLQFSANAAVGITYPIYKKLYLYGTIGGAYYFDAGNKYPTIYTDRKMQLDLNLGIKFDF
ncbi:hypothetical protein D0T84_02765 [Dysgonomonas sp. 521]|uniref:hypothetical protein n=1 Tax=Dysgonomonas sp. 521 TaxID=2302932 RepID=UPI0013D4E78B|nr:hypothetical protein [Dysgonomonas sp. 521]NDV93840.1 hypothetical protein [Dysgonomonas sp. 521]